MAIKRKTDLKQTYRSKPRRTPPTAPLDLVRSPNFDSAMAQQRYDQMLADMTARAKAGQFDTRIDEVGQQSTNSTAGYAQVDPMTGMQGNQSIYDSLRDYQARTYPVPMGGNPNGIGQQFGQIPQQQMQNYQNFLQQGMQNSNTMNQGAMNNFANMQPGMQATQTASTATPNQTMPVAGMGMQQPKQTPPRKFSTVRNSPARFA